MESGLPRLIDDLRAGGRIAMPWFIERAKQQQWIDYAHRVNEIASDPALPILLIDNVAQYFYTGTDQEYWSLDKDFPNVRAITAASSSRPRKPRRPMHSSSSGS